MSKTECMVLSIACFIVAYACSLEHCGMLQLFYLRSKPCLLRDNDKLTTCVVNISKTFAHPDVIDSAYKTALIFHPVDDLNYKFLAHTGENIYCLEDDILRKIYNDQQIGYSFPCYRYPDTLKLCPPCRVDGLWVKIKMYECLTILGFAASIIVLASYQR